jgi:hypothetical protein
VSEMDAWKLGQVASKWIEENFQPASRILEFGSGSGTYERAQKYDVTAIEHDEDFLSSDYRCIHASIKANEISSKYDETGWYDPKKISLINQEKFDLIIIDGPPGAIGRKGILHFPWIFQLADIILVDDTHRESEGHLSEKIIHWMGTPEVTELIENGDFGFRKCTIIQRV